MPKRRRRQPDANESDKRNGLVCIEEKHPSLSLSKCKIMRNKLVLDESISFDEWKTNAMVLKQVNDSVQFWIGDLVNFGREKFNRIECNEVLKNYGYKRETIRDFSWVSSSVKPSLLKDTLTFSHHKEVAELEPSQQEYWLNKAEEENLSVQELRKQIRESEKPFNPSLRRTGEITAEERWGKVDIFKNSPSLFGGEGESGGELLLKFSYQCSSVVITCSFLSATWYQTVNFVILPFQQARFFQFPPLTHR